MLLILYSSDVDFILTLPFILNVTHVYCSSNSEKYLPSCLLLNCLLYWPYCNKTSTKAATGFLDWQAFSSCCYSIAAVYTETMIGKQSGQHGDFKRILLPKVVGFLPNQGMSVQFQQAFLEPNSAFSISWWKDIL